MPLSPLPPSGKRCDRLSQNSPRALRMAFLLRESFFPEIVRSGKLQNKSFPNFSNFRPEFCPEFCSKFFPNFSRNFRASFRGRRRPEIKKSPPFFNAKFPGKHEKNIHKILLKRAGKVRNWDGPQASDLFEFSGSGLGFHASQTISIQYVP